MGKQQNVSLVRLTSSQREGKQPNVLHVRIEHHVKEMVDSQLSRMYVLDIISKVLVNGQISHMYALNIISRKG